MKKVTNAENRCQGVGLLLEATGQCGCYRFGTGFLEELEKARLLQAELNRPLKYEAGRPERGEKQFQKETRPL